METKIIKNKVSFEDRFKKMNLFEQLGNVASEISRACYFETKKDVAARDNAIERGLELLDLTLSGGRGQKEIARLREGLTDVMAGTGMYDLSLDQIRDYLMPFALLARR